MFKGYFNWKLAIILLIAAVLIAVTAFGLRKFQRNRMSALGLKEGIKAYEKGEWEEAAKNLGRYLSASGNDVPILLKYADSQLNIRPLKSNNLQQAIASFRQILRVDKGNSKAALTLIKLYLQMDAHGEAELIAKRYLETKQDPEIRRLLAEAYAWQRKFNEAAAELRSLIKEHPDQILAYEIIGQLNEQRPESFQGLPVDWFNQAIKNNPTHALAYVIRANYYFRNNLISKALSDLTEAEKQDLSDSEVRLRLAREFLNANLLDKAEEHFIALKKVDSTNQELWQGLGQLALRTGDHNKMLNIAEDGLKSLSSSSQPWDFMPMATELFIQCGQFDQASDCISKLRQKDIAPKMTPFLEGLILEKKGFDYEAAKCFYQAIQLSGDSARIRLQLAMVLSRLGDRQSAIQQLRKIISDRPNYFWGRLNLAKQLAETGNWAEAAEHARIAMQINPKNADAALLNLNAKMELLTKNKIEKGSTSWKNLEKEFEVMEKASSDPLAAKLLRVQLAVRQSQFDKAQNLLIDLKNSYPKDQHVALAEVEFLNAQGKIEEAVSRLYEAVKVFPESIDIVKYLSFLLNYKGERGLCEKVLKEALGSIKGPVVKSQLGLNLARFYSSWGEQEKCYQFLISLASDVPDDILIQRELLKCEKLTKEPDIAQQIVDKIKAIEGETGWQWRYEQARIWYAAINFKDRYSQIISILKENLIANQEDQASRLLLAATYEKGGESRLAISTYNEALNQSPNDLRIIIPFVSILYREKEYSQADEILNHLQIEDQNSPQLLGLKFQSYLRRGELSSADDILGNFLRTDPNNQSIALSLSLLKMQQKKFDEADQILNKLKTQDPNSLTMAIARVELNIRQGKSKEALILCDEIVEKFNNASAYIIRGNTYAFVNQLGKAAEDLEHAAALEPENIEAWIAKSDFYRLTGRFDKALSDIRKAISLEPDNVLVIKRAAVLFLASGDHEMAAEGTKILDKAIAANPDDVGLCLLKAGLLLDQGISQSIRQANDLLLKRVETNPNVSDAWVMLANIARKKGQHPKALDTILSGLAYLPNNKKLMLFKANLEAEKSPELAIPTLKTLLEYNPHDIEVALYLANTYLDAGKAPEALNLIKQLLASQQKGSSNEQKLKITFATILYRSGNKSEAQNEFNSLVLLSPDDPNLLLARCRMLKDEKLLSQINEIVTKWYQNNPKDSHTPVAVARDLMAKEDNETRKTAETILRTVIEKDANSIEAISALALLLQVTQNHTESVVLYRRLLELQPDNVIAMNNLSWLLCEEQGKYEEALEFAERGLRIAPNYTDLIDTVGYIYYKMGKYDKAVQRFTNCVELYPEGTPAAASSYLHLGKCLSELHNKNEGINALKNALKLNSEFGGLSETEVKETQNLLEKLSKGG